ncbi:TPA: carbohydrate kinase [Escherichia coli]|nr:carbohydrate kinase [Escherichia coli]ELX9878055.1 carbohydrate kinase [Escherichia coli]HAH2175483.1 carbohydrate kinase [Escherichia coli]HBA6997583.1 carbohydrate kinase [Escherichia coli]HBA7329000.1 carbohydrate kinase [Escherichia coli]
MHRIDTKTAQKDKFGAGKNGFTRGNPQTGTPATDLDDDYFDMLQEELCSVVEASGASLEKARHDQLLTALRTLLLSRKNPFGDIKSDGTVKTALENLGLGDTSGYVGRWVNTRVFTSSGTYTPTPGTKRIRVTITGGGGGGGGCQAISNNETFFGAGGGAGGTIISIMTPTQNSYPVTIGAGGAGGIGANYGLNGGYSSFASLIAIGGEGAGKVGVTNTNGGNGGVPSTGDIRITGGNGGDGQSGNIGVSGEGGTSYWGGGGRAGAGGGVSGKAYGSGGGGAYDVGYSGTSMKGGKGAAGICIIEEFA